MGGYYGSPDSVMKNNKAQRRTAHTKRDWKDYIGTKEVQTDDFIKASPELLEEIRKKIQKENKNRKITHLILFLLSIVITILIIHSISNLEWVGIDLNKIIR